MKDIRLDSLNRTRCWKCGGKSFEPLSSHLSRGHENNGSILHQPNLECTRCGALNKVGNAVRYQGPDDAAYADEWEKEQKDPNERGALEKDLRPDDNGNTSTAGTPPSFVSTMLSNTVVERLGSIGPLDR